MTSLVQAVVTENVCMRVYGDSMVMCLAVLLRRICSVRRVADNADPLGHAEEDVGTESRASLSLTEHEPVQLLKM